MVAEERLRKSSQEVELDHLLAEEFACDPGFVRRFMQACKLGPENLVVRSVTAEPSLGGNGFGDILVDCEADGRSVALLVEDKITAAPATRQAQRYRAHADGLRAEGWNQVYCIVVAPGGWRGDRTGYDAHLALERLAEIIESPSPARLAWRRSILDRALRKYRATGVRVADAKVRDFKAAYLEVAQSWSSRNAVPFTFPALKEAYYDGDSWIDPILHPALPDPYRLRHRCWTSVRRTPGLVDLIVRGTDARRVAMLTACRPAGTVISSFSGGKGIVVSLPVTELRPGADFDCAGLEDALAAMALLVEWIANLTDV